MNFENVNRVSLTLFFLKTLYSSQFLDFSLLPLSYKV